MSRVRSVPRAVWSPLPRVGCHNVEGKVLLLTPGLGLSQLRFGEHASIDEHSASMDIDVICLEGRGWTRIDGELQEIRTDQSVRWPANKLHVLFTEASTMLALMVEHRSQQSQ